MSRRRKRKRRGLRHHSTPTPTLPFQSYAGTAGAGQTSGHQSCCLPRVGRRDWERWMGGKMEGRSLQSRGGTSLLLLPLPPCTPLALALRTREHCLSKGKKENTAYTTIKVTGGFKWQRAGQGLSLWVEDADAKLAVVLVPLCEASHLALLLCLHVSPWLWGK